VPKRLPHQPDTNPPGKRAESRGNRAVSDAAEKIATAVESPIGQSSWQW
jgi:hypothetical protein